MKQKKYPIVIQTEKTECAVCCILMILKYYKGYLPKEEIRYQTRTNKFGTSAYHIVEAFKSYGFNSYGLKTDFSEDNMVFPLIAHIKTEEDRYHYVVVYKYDFKRKVLLVADPESGLIKYNLSEFMKLFTGIVIISYPIGIIPCMEENNTLIKIIITILKKYKKSFIFLFILSLLFGLFVLLSGIHTTALLDGINGLNGEIWIRRITVIFIIIIFLKHSTDYIRVKLLLFLNHKIELYITGDLLTRFLHLPYNYYLSRTTGELLSKIELIKSLNEIISKIVLFIFFDSILFIFLLLFFLKFNIILFFINIFYFIILIFIYLISKKEYYNLFSKTFLRKQEVTQKQKELFQYAVGLKSIHLENNFLTFLKNKLLSFQIYLFSYELFQIRYEKIKSILQDLFFIIEITILAFLYFNKKIELGHFFLFQLYFSYLTSIMEHVMLFLISIEDSKHTFNQLNFLYRKGNEKEYIKTKLEGNIECRNLEISFNGVDKVVSNINLKIDKGDKVFLTGNSGIGKSSFLKVLMGYYDVNRGELLFDQVDSKDCKREKIYLLNQERLIFNDSLYNNIVMKRVIDSKKLIKVIKMCNIDKILNDRNETMEMMVGEDGKNLSGGECQRIILARTLLSDFEILLIDEGFSEMDERLEYNIIRELFSQYKEKTIIVVSHRKVAYHLYNKHIFLSKDGCKVL